MQHARDPVNLTSTSWVGKSQNTETMTAAFGRGTEF